jgi:hypothetical protein
MRILASHGEVGGPLPTFVITLIRLAVLRDVEERGRDIEGCIKQWFAFVKPNFERYVEPQRKVAGESAFSILINSNEYRYHRTTGGGEQSRN